MRTQNKLAISRIQIVLQTLAILAMMAGLFGFLGYLLLGTAGLIIALSLIIVFLATSPRISPKMVLRMYGSRELRQDEAPALYGIMAELAALSDLKKRPRLYYIPSRVMNAFSVGSPHDSAIAVSDGMLRYLNLRELAGVLGHEIGHIRNNDLWIYALADMFTRITSALSLFGQALVIVYLPLWIFAHKDIPLTIIALLVFAPSLSMVMQLALSRQREYAADMGAVELTGDSQGLASALNKMEQYQRSVWDTFLRPGRKLPEPSVLRTHPYTAERIKRLLALDEGRPFAHEQHGALLPDYFLVIERPPRWHWFRPWY
jgi:heat shock protein HtpX